MKAVVVPSDLLGTVRRFAAESYPEECCGFLLAAPETVPSAAERCIVDALPSPNRARQNRGHRFVIPPEELRSAERWASTRDLVVAGFYHSHPDHPARPSAFDQEHAWPWYVYLIAASRAGGPGPVGAFELDPDRREFREIALRSEAADSSLPPAGAR